MMFEPSRLAHLIKEMNNHKLDIVGLCETHLNGTGEHTHPSGEVLLYFGKQPKQKHEYSVVLLLSKTTKRNLLSWEPINKRILTALLKTKLRQLTIVLC